MVADADLGVIDLDSAPSGIDLQLSQDTPHRERCRAAIGRISGACHGICDEAWFPGAGCHPRHDLVGVAIGTADEHAVRTQAGRDIGCACNKIGKVSSNTQVLRYEDVVDRIDIGLRWSRASHALSFGRDPGHRQQRRDMGALGHPHGNACLFDSDGHAEYAEGFDEGAHRRERAVINNGSGPVEYDSLDLVYSLDPKVGTAQGSGEGDVATLCAQAGIM